MSKLSKRNLRFIFILLVLAAILVIIQQLPQTSHTTIDKLSNATKVNQPGLYTVTKFIDGDTIIVDMDGQSQNIRFIGVDTPEEHDARKPVQCYAIAAAQHTKDLIAGNKVRLASDPLSDNRDRYDRLLRYVYSPRGLLVNQQIVADGYGFAIKSFPFTKMASFVTAQAQAKQQNKGLWSKCTVDYPNGYPQTNAVGPPPTY